MVGQSGEYGGGRGDAVERKLWTGLTDYAVDAFGSELGGAVVREAYVRDSPDLVLAAIANRLGEEATAVVAQAA